MRLTNTWTLAAIAQGVTIVASHEHRRVPHAEFARQDPATDTSVTYSLHSVNPTALPLESFTGGATSVPTATYSTPAAGEKPTSIPNAPGLPDSAYTRKKKPEHVDSF